MATLHNFTDTSVTFGGHLTSRFLSVPRIQAHPACAHHRWVLIGSGVHGCRGPRAERHRRECEHPPRWPLRAPDKQSRLVGEARSHQPTNPTLIIVEHSRLTMAGKASAWSSFVSVILGQDGGTVVHVSLTFTPDKPAHWA